MRRFVTLACLLLFTVPFGISISGCGKASATIFCNGGDSGPVIGQLVTITLQPLVFGISLNAGEISPTTPTATGVDCKGSTVGVASYTYGVRTQDLGLVDVVPTTGRLCAGTWNRSSGAGIPDYTVCSPSTRYGSAYLTASANGANSNAIPIFVHPVATSVVIGPPSTNCATDLATNCCPFSTTGAVTAPTGNYTGNSCLSQNVTGQVAARVFANGGTTVADNITCVNTGTAAAPVFAPLVGHLTYTPQDATIVAIDENGIATARNPGTTVISALISNASSSAGYFSTCPPANIKLSVPNQGSATSIVVNQNTTQPITATVTDTNGVTLNGISLSFVSTTPRTLPNTGTGSTTPTFPGAGTITALCLPPTCNNAPLNEIGLFGTGKPVASNGIEITTPGSNSTLLYAGSTASQYLTTIDFTRSIVSSPVRLPYVPNSMVLSTDGGTIYLGNQTELMVFSTGASAISREDRSAPGKVLAVSPDNSTVVISDPVRQTIALWSAATSAITSIYGGVGTSAQFSPDSSMVYVAAGNQLVVHSTYTGWTSIPNLSVNDVTVTVPSVGAFLAGSPTTARSYCSVTTQGSANGQPVTTNQFYPDAGVTAPAADHIAATNDGAHVLSVTSTAVPTLTDLAVNVENGNTGVGVACPPNGLTFTATPLVSSLPLPGVAATAVTGIIPSSNSTTAFVTYTGTGGVLPVYTLGSGAGTESSVPLSGTATAPVAGIFSSDNLTFFVGTSGDNLIHLVTQTTSGFSDTIAAPISPKLVDLSGNPTPANLLQQRPRRTT